jgi:hypothetical protein
MGTKRARAETGKRGKNATAPHKLVVQRLAAEPDNKQTFRDGPLEKRGGGAKPKKYLFPEKNEGKKYSQA